MTSPWHVLGIARGSSLAEVKKAYARLLRQHRPDQDPVGFRRLRDAYELAVRMVESGLEWPEHDHEHEEQEEEDGRLRPQPVFCLAHKKLLPHLTTFLGEGGRKVERWYADLKVAEVWFADESAFRNINTRDELHAQESAAFVVGHTATP